MSRHLSCGNTAASAGRAAKASRHWQGGCSRRSSGTVAASSPPLSSGIACHSEEHHQPTDRVDIAAAAGADAERIGVLLLNLGGPDTLDDVQPFLYNLFADPDIIRLPGWLQWLQPLIAQAISTARAPKSRKGYAAIGGGSPLRAITQSQADALAEALRQRGQDAHTYLAMRYWRPFTEEAVECIKRDGITKLIVLPLYPQFSVSTSGSSLRLLEKLFKEDPVLRQVRHAVIPSWYQRPGYVGAMAGLIQTSLEQGFPPSCPRDEVEIFFSAHGVPVSYVEEGDPYKEEMEHCVQLIMEELRRRGVTNSHLLAYQSRVGPVKWLQPYTDDSIRQKGAQGTTAMLAVPISFVSEHIETLEEMDVEYKALAEESGIKHWARVPALNVDPAFIDDLAEAVLEALPYVGKVEALLETYDSERKVLPSPIINWTPSWRLSTRAWDGRSVVLGLVLLLLLLELSTGHGMVTSLLGR